MVDYGPLRRNQQQALEVARAIAAGTEARRVIAANVTPGGGKTMMASIFAHELIGAGVVDRVCIVCPRDALRSQVAQSFTSRQRGLAREIVAERNGKLHQKGLLPSSGYVTTYQSIDAAPGRHLKRMARGRWLVVLDEPHHLAEDDNARWKEAVDPIVQNAHCVLLMSGTLWRHDRKRIPFVEYDDVGRAIAQITYTRADALREQAVLQLDITRYDGFVSYSHREADQNANLSSAVQKEQARALKTALLDPEYADELVLQSLHSWKAYRSSIYPSRALVVCHAQREAVRVARLISGEFRDVEVALAVSEERDATKKIRHFREHRYGDVLVTVGMAYEGLDVPDCSHLVCMTDVRSYPWLDQCFARVTRFNKDCGVPWEQQLAYVSVPDDARMRDYISNMAQEQFSVVRQMGMKGRPIVHVQSTFRPGSAELTEARFGFEDGMFSEEENSLVRKLISEHPFMLSAPHQEKLRFARAIYGVKKPNGSDNGASVPSIAP